MTKWFALLCLGGVAGAQNPPAASGPRPDGRLVVVDVLVHTKAGPVTGLTKDDFTLTDKGKAQKIDVFAATVDQDPNAKDSPLSPGVGSNRMNRHGVPMQSATIILYDRLNTPPADQAFTRKQVLELLSSLKDTDRFAFCSLGRQLTLVTDFTEDPAPLIRAAARLNAAVPQAAPADPAEQAMQKALEDALGTQQSIDMLYRVATTSRAFQSITRHLSGLQGRKSIAWITRSFPLTFGADVYRRTDTDKELTAATVLLQEENIALYPINPGGVGKGQGDQSTVTTDRPVEGRLMPGANSSISDAGALSDISTMENIANATGGVAYYNINEITSKAREVLADAALTYTLGYYPENKMLDGKSHDFGVKVAKTSGATLRYRKNYVANKQASRSQTPPVPELAGDPLDATAVTLAAYAQPDPKRPGFQAVDVSVNVGDLRLDHKGDHWTGGFELGLFMEGGSGGSGSVQTINLNLTDDQLKQALSSGLVVHSAIDTKGQPIKLRVAVRDHVSGAGGAVRLPMIAQ